MDTDSSLRRWRIRVIAIVQDHQLHIAKQSLHGIVIWTCLGQTDPVQLQFPHHATRLAGFARMGAILIQNYPDFLGGIPLPHAAHETTNMFRIFAGVKSPADASLSHIIQRKQVEKTARLLTPLQHQAFG